MNQPYLNKRNTLVTLLFLCTAFVIYSCRKDLNNTQQNPDNAIALARAWYQQTYPAKAGADLKFKDINTLASETNGDLSQLIKPDWNSANVYEKQGRQVIEMPLDSAVKIGFTPPPANGNINSLNFNKLYSKTSFLILGNSKSYKAYIMTIIADTTWLAGDFSKLKTIAYNHKPANFSGKLIYFTPIGTPVSGYSYHNGKITGILSRVPSEHTDATIKQNAEQTAKKNQAYSCTTTETWVHIGTVCTGPTANPYQYCNYVFKRYTFIDCVYQAPEVPQQQIDFIAPDEQVGPPYSTVTEETVEKTEYCSQQMCRDTSIINDSLLNCLFNLLDGKNHIFDSLAAAYKTSYNMDLRFTKSNTITDNGLTNFNAMSFSNGKYTGVATVNLNANYVRDNMGSSYIDVARTILHETWHAELFQKVFSTYRDVDLVKIQQQHNGKPIKDFTTAELIDLLNVDQNGTLANNGQPVQTVNGWSNLEQHNYMVKHIDIFARGLGELLSDINSPLANNKEFLYAEALSQLKDVSTYFTSHINDFVIKFPNKANDISLTAYISQVHNQNKSNTGILPCSH